MKRLHIFVEGICDLIFTKELLLKLYNKEDIFIYCHSQNKNESERTGFKEKNYIGAFGPKYADLQVTIIDATGDTNIVSMIDNNIDKLQTNGTTIIIVLWDILTKIYYDAFKKYADKNKAIAEVVSIRNAGMEKYRNKFEALNLLPQSFFAIMEIESWLLAFPRAIEKSELELSLTMIKQKTNIAIEEIDPETDIQEPWKEIFKKSLKNRRFRSKPLVCEKISSEITPEMIHEIRGKKVASLHKFVDKLIEVGK